MKEVNVKRNFLLVVLLLLPGLVAAATIGVKDVAEALQKPFASDVVQARGSDKSGIFDFQGDFFQQSEIAAIERVQRGRGLVSFRFTYPGGNRVPLSMFRWEYLEPTQQEVISDAETLWVYLPDNRQVIVSDVAEISRQRQDNPMTFLTGLGNLSRDFQIRWGSPNSDLQGNYVLELRPRRASNLIRTLQIVVDRRAVLDYVEKQQVGNYFPIMATTVMDPAGNKTTIEFSKINFNVGLAASYFRFVQPAGVDILRPEGSKLPF